ncbi:MAG: hypothetical protein ACOX3V_03725 [Bacillota bacterium]|jgi:hypothetical protein
MSDQTNVLKEVTRSFSDEGREFTVVYQLGEKEGPYESKCFLRASLMEKDSSGFDKTTGCYIDFLYLDTRTSLRIFDAIAGAKAPVMPVHLPEIVRDKLSAFRHYEEKLCL